MFSFVWLEGQLAWNIPLLAVFICIALIYGYLLRSVSTLQIYHKQPILLLLGLFSLYLTIGSPLATISHLSFSFHMIQMSILFFIIPPLILLGIPVPMFERIWGISIIQKLSKLSLPPMIALTTFSLLFLMYHLPIVLKFLSQILVIHNGYILLLFILSFSMWWPIAAPDPKQRFSGKRKKRYAFLSGLIIMPACILFIITALMNEMNNPFLSQMSLSLCLPPDIPSLYFLPTIFNSRIDQLMAGILMLGMHKLGLVMTYRLGDKI